MKTYFQNDTRARVTDKKMVTKRALNLVEGVMSKATQEMDGYIAPIRSSVLNRYPIVFSLLTTFGVATTFLGFEKIVSNIAFLDQHPIIMLLLGICILAATGTLYKKLL